MKAWASGWIRIWVMAFLCRLRTVPMLGGTITGGLLTVVDRLVGTWVDILLGGWQSSQAR